MDTAISRNGALAVTASPWFRPAFSCYLCSGHERKIRNQIMAPLIILIVVSVLARLIGRLGVAALRDWPAASRVGLAVMFCFTAAAHFNSMRPDLIRMVPPQVPNAEFMVSFTGICEILGAIGLLVPQTRRLAGVALVLFLVAVLPANIHAALSGVTLAGAPVTPLIPRVLLQLIFIALVWWSGVRSPSELSHAATRQANVET